MKSVQNHELCEVYVTRIFFEIELVLINRLNYLFELKFQAYSNARRAIASLSESWLFVITLLTKNDRNFRSFRNRIY
jgi:hypothetical protein